MFLINKQSKDYNLQNSFCCKLIFLKFSNVYNARIICISEKKKKQIFKIPDRNLPRPL